jgi:hypothetical protein
MKLAVQCLFFRINKFLFTSILQSFLEFSINFVVWGNIACLSLESCLKQVLFAYRVNESAEIQSSIKKMKIISWSLTLGVPALTSALCYFIWKKLK